jgi:fluoride exporter
VQRYVRAMITVFWVALGGAIGATGRYLVAMQTLRFFGPGFPWGTLSVNIAGSLAMGLLAGLFAHRLQVSLEIRMFLMTGILGGFTTFSAFSLDVSVLVARKDYMMSALYIIGSVSLSVAALFIGLRVARMMFA